MTAPMLAAFLRDVLAESVRRRRASWRRTHALLVISLLAAWAIATGIGAAVG